MCLRHTYPNIKPTIRVKTVRCKTDQTRKDLYLAAFMVYRTDVENESTLKVQLPSQSKNEPQPAAQVTPNSSKHPNQPIPRTYLVCNSLRSPIDRTCKAYLLILCLRPHLAASQFIAAVSRLLSALFSFYINVLNRATWKSIIGSLGWFTSASNVSIGLVAQRTILVLIVSWKEKRTGNQITLMFRHDREESADSLYNIAP
jgi:hypothetical protein